MAGRRSPVPSQLIIAVSYGHSGNSVLRPGSSVGMRRLLSWNRLLLSPAVRALAESRHALYLKGGLYDRRLRRFVPIADLIHAIGIAPESPVPSPEVAAFLDVSRKLMDRGALTRNVLDGHDP
jgi:hypothetical protein